MPEGLFYIYLIMGGVLFLFMTFYFISEHQAKKQNQINDYAPQTNSSKTFRRLF